MVPRMEEGAGVAAPTPKVDPFCGCGGFAKVSESDSSTVFHSLDMRGIHRGALFEQFGL